MRAIDVRMYRLHRARREQQCPYRFARERVILAAMRLIGVCAIALVRPLTIDHGSEEPITVMTREGNGATTVRAVRIDAPLRIDGALDEEIYRRVAPMTGFIQIEPDDGAVASERTDLWLAFDDDNVYVSFRVWDSQMDRLVATEMRRDNGIIWSGNDNVVFVFDTFNDRRSAVSFTVIALGGRADGQVINERQFNPDWNPVWTSRPAASTAAGRWRAPCPSNRSAISRAPARRGASTPRA
jgi:hypothetical protein